MAPAGDLSAKSLRLLDREPADGHSLPVGWLTGVRRTHVLFRHAKIQSVNVHDWFQICFYILR